MECELIMIVLRRTNDQSTEVVRSVHHVGCSPGVVGKSGRRSPKVTCVWVRLSEVKTEGRPFRGLTIVFNTHVEVSLQEFRPPVW